MNGTVKGMETEYKELEAQYGQDKNYYVPVKTLFWSFRDLAGGGVLLFLLGVRCLWYCRKKKDTLSELRWLLYILGFALWLPFNFNTAGWYFTELGRYPWVVYGLYTIADAVSHTTTAGTLLYSHI